MNIKMTCLKCRMVCSIGRILPLLLMPLSLFAFLSTVSAEEKGITTLMPTEVLTEAKPSCPALTISADGQGKSACRVLLRFKTSSFPGTATLTGARLSLVAEKSPSGNARQNVLVDMLDFNAELNSDQGTVFGAADISSKTKRADWSNDSDEIIKKANVTAGFALRLTSTSSSRSVQWYSDKTNTSSYRPRLILEYSLPDQPAITQSDGLTSVLSPRAFVPEKNSSLQKAYVTRKVTLDQTWSYTPAFYNNLVYIITEKASEKYLQALSPLGGLIWSLPVDNPGQHLAVSNSGRLYIVGNQQIIVFQLDPNDPAQIPKALPVRVPDLNPAIPPTIGPDGSLYLVNLQQVYGFNPNLKELWKVTLKGIKTSPVTLGPSREYVYLTTEDEGLIMINAQTGEKIFPTNNESTQSMFAGAKYLSAPVVIRHTDGTEKIYASANTANSGVIVCLNNFKTTDERNNPVKFQCPEDGWKSLTGLFSQPGLDANLPDLKKGKNLYSVRVANGQGKLIAVDWLNGSITQGDEVIKVGDSPYLLNGGNLALDHDGTIIMWNGEDQQLNLYAFENTLNRIIDSSISGLPNEYQLLFGTDGTLYVNDVKGRVLRAILPSYTIDSYSESDIHSPTHLHVNGKVNKNTVLSASGSVILGNGFTVTNGTKLSIKTSSLEQ